MVKRGASIGFFGRFGRSQDMQNLDRALRFSGLHPAQVPEGVKLAAVGIIAGDGGDEPAETAYPPVGNSWLSVPWVTSISRMRMVRAVRRARAGGLSGLWRRGKARMPSSSCFCFTQS